MLDVGLEPFHPMVLPRFDVALPISGPAVMIRRLVLAASIVAAPATSGDSRIGAGPRGQGATRHRQALDVVLIVVGIPGAAGG
jgi:hypothetical protein